MIFEYVWWKKRPTVGSRWDDHIQQLKPSSCSNQWGIPSSELRRFLDTIRIHHWNITTPKLHHLPQDDQVIINKWENPAMDDFFPQNVSPFVSRIIEASLLEVQVGFHGPGQACQFSAAQDSTALMVQHLKPKKYRVANGDKKMVLQRATQKCHGSRLKPVIFGRIQWFCCLKFGKTSENNKFHGQKESSDPISWSWMVQRNRFFTKGQVTWSYLQKPNGCKAVKKDDQLC